MSDGIGLAEAKAIVDAFNSGKTAYQRPDQNRQRPPAQQAAAAAAAVAAEAVAERQPTAPPSDDLSAISLRNMGLGEVQHSNASFWLVVFLAFVALIGYVALSR